MKKRFIAAAVPVLVAGSLAAAAPGMSQAADNDDKAAQLAAPKASAVAAAEVTPCTGGAQKKAMTGGSSDWVEATSPITVPGTFQQFKGPKSGKDTVFVTLTAHHTWVANNGDMGRARVLLDGVDMTPTTGGNEYFYYDSNSGSLAGQYCAKVGPGFHKVRVILENFGSGSSYLHNPMVHVEVAN